LTLTYQQVVAFSQKFKSYLMSLINQVVPIFVVLYIAKYEVLELSGRFYLLMSFAALVQLVLDYGFNLGAIREINEAGDHESIVEIFCSIFIVKLVAFALLSASLLLFNAFILVLSNDILLAIMLGGCVAVTNVSWLYIGMKKVSEYYGLLLLYRVSFCIPIFFLENTPSTYVIIALVPTTILFVHAVRLINTLKTSIFVIRNFSTRKIKDILAGSSSIFFNGLLGSGISMGWPIILSTRLDVSAIGVFGLADRIIKGMVSLCSPIPPLIISGEIPLKSAKYGVVPLIIFMLLAPTLLWISLPLAVVSSFEIGALTVLKDKYEYLLLLTPIYLANMFLYTYLIVVKKEVGYGYSILFAALIAAIFIERLDNAIYAPLLFELTVLFAAVIYLISLKFTKH
jgi:O-antigen/teichoic acid export membrane protein